MKKVTYAVQVEMPDTADENHIVISAGEKYPSGVYVNMHVERQCKLTPDMAEWLKKETC